MGWLPFRTLLVWSTLLLAGPSIAEESRSNRMVPGDAPALGAFLVTRECGWT